MIEIKSNNKSEEFDSGTSSLVELEEPKLKKPSLYRVILLNDDYTPDGVCHLRPTNVF